VARKGKERGSRLEREGDKQGGKGRYRGRKRGWEKGGKGRGVNTMSHSENSLKIHWLDPNASKPVFGGGSAPDLAEGACDDPPTPSLAGKVPSPYAYPSSLEAFGVSISFESSPHQRLINNKVICRPLQVV